MLKRLFGRKDVADGREYRWTKLDVALVGHCGADSAGLTRLVNSALPGASVVKINDRETLESRLSHHTLLLVNRGLDGDFGVENGVELIRELRTATGGPTAMLISNYSDAQREAQAAGAMPGFGKSQVREPLARQRLRAAARMVNAG